MKRIYLDNAATSYPKLACVKEEVMRSMDIMGNANRTLCMDTSLLIFKTRQRVAYFFGCKAENVILNSGATESLNTVLCGLIDKNDHVVTSFMEHNSVLRCLYHIGCDLSISGFDEIMDHLQINTKAVVLTHSSNVTGDVYPFESLYFELKKRNILLIMDVAQSAGHLPVSLEYCDVLCFSGHKGLLGLTGIGGFCIKSDLHCKPLIYGGTGMDSFNHDMPLVSPEKYEAGTRNLIGISSLYASIEYVSKHREEIHQKEMELLDYLYTNIKDLKNIIVYRDANVIRTPILAINIKDIDSSIVSRCLYDHYGIITRCQAHCAPLMHKYLGTEKQGIVRISMNFMNTKEEMDVVIRAMHELCEEFS